MGVLQRVVTSGEKAYQTLNQNSLWAEQRLPAALASAYHPGNASR